MNSIEIWKKLELDCTRKLENFDKILQTLQKADESLDGIRLEFRDLARYDAKSQSLGSCL